MKITLKKLIIILVEICGLAFFTSSALQADGFGPLPTTLKDAPVPEVPGLLDGSDPIILNKEKAIILGKSLFWDINVGSDGIACASCHFHAGADRRIKNQIAPIGRNSKLSKEFSQASDGSSLGPNATLKKNDFPFFQLTDPFDPTSTVLYHSDDVVSSAGTFGGTFSDIPSSKRSGNDNCDRGVDPVHHVGTKGTRKVEPRNTPTVINAVFNFRNLWDGRANNIFNGSSSWGDRDPDAGVWIKNSDGTITKQRLRLINSSLASQALGPAMDDIEMSCHERTFPDLGRKLLNRKPLEKQNVHWNDSVLGVLALSTPGKLKKGLNTRYEQLIKESFNPKFWDDNSQGQFGTPPGSAKSDTPYSQLEANFAMFFALAIQLYESTLISDDSPFDRSAVDEHGMPIELSESAQRGMDIFRDSHCALCHIGPNFTSSAVETNGLLQKINPHAFGNDNFRISSTTVVTYLSLTAGMMFQDVGFSGTGVTPEENDIGLAATDPFGNPLSFSDQYMQLLAGNLTGVVDPYVSDVRPCDLDTAIALDRDAPHALLFTRADGIRQQEQNMTECFNSAGTFIPTIDVAKAELDNPDRRRFLSAAEGSFKIPTLRNIELTGPYMHNGGMATLEEVLEFYIRGGNFTVAPKEFGKIFELVELRLSPEKREDLLNFLKSLTDDRVRYEKAPFDHPELLVPHGHLGDNALIKKSNSINKALAADEFLIIPAVGAEGKTEPLQAFENYLK